MSSERVPLPDLTTCDREPITRLDRIQNFGFLVALSNDWTVIRASANLGGHLGIDATSAIGGSFDAAVTPEALAAIRDRAARLQSTGNERLFGVRLMADRARFDLNLHLVDDILIIEGEPSVDDEIRDAAPMIRMMMEQLGKALASDAFLWAAAGQVREITGFDRVMVYRIGPSGSGEVIADSTGPGIESLVGLHYPGSDIPKQAQALYLRNTFRITSDVNASAVPVLPAGDALPLDLSQSITRAASPIHIEYLNNMGVSATLSISIIVDGKLWGLFTCHHFAPRLPSFVMRTAADLYGCMFSLALENRLARASVAALDSARARTDVAFARVAASPKLLATPEWLQNMVAEMFDYDGMAIYLGGAAVCQGETPLAEGVAAIAQYLSQAAPGRVFTTDQLTSIGTLSAADLAGAAGMLAIPISHLPGDYIMLFRREHIRSVNWGGDPGKFSATDPGARISPRKSFAAFVETVRGKSRPFLDSDRRSGDALRNAMVEAILKLSAASSAALAAEVEARRQVEREVFGLNEDFEAKVRERTGELSAANDRLAKKIVVGAAALKSSRAEVGTGRADLLASESALVSSQLVNNARLFDLMASEDALATARAETELGVADLHASEAALASSQAETKLGVADLRSSTLALAASRAETELGIADLHASVTALASSQAERRVGAADLQASKLALAASQAETEVGVADLKASQTALASSQAETRSSAADLLLSATHLAASRAETKVGVADLLASTLALAASRAEMKISLADLLIGAVDLAASQAETKAGESQLLDSEDANRVLARANEVLVINEVALEKLVAQRTAALRAEINTRRIMATAIAHELNQPLAAVSSYLNGTARLAERSDAGLGTLAMIAEGSRQAAKNAIRAGDILKLLRNSITRDDTAVTDEDITSIIAETVAVAIVDGDGLGIKFRFDSSAIGMNAMVNRTQIRQVLANLIQNSVDAVTGMARREVTIAVSNDTAQGMLTVDVADTGPGVPPQQLAGLFMPFVSNKPYGMGIGLSISREIAEQHHGKLTTRANPGGGAIFSLVLPLSEAVAAAPVTLQ